MPRAGGWTVGKECADLGDTMGPTLTRSDGPGWRKGKTLSCCERTAQGTKQHSGVRNLEEGGRRQGRSVCGPTVKAITHTMLVLEPFLGAR
jgi:hypothetical protein